ncbi:MAG: DUF4091 domain-containing protein [Clostridia bacterium]|nr:DUF4091 domain-containing protein [Clostridia bacterium]
MLICCADSCERILKYDKIVEKHELTLTALKGGTDSSQIAVFGNDKQTVGIKVEDLFDGEGNVFSADNFALYYEKYIYVDKNWQKNGFPIGWYPDALIPINSPVFHGENETGNGNVCIWIDVTVPREQIPGVYSGVFRINDIGIVVRLEVCAAELPAEITHKSIFTLNGEHMAHYEGETSKEMVKAYNDCLLRHRVCSAIPDSDGKTSWADDIAEYLSRGANTVNIPSPYAEEKNERYGNTPDYEDLLSRLIQLKEKSIETEIDLFSYVVYYDWMIDEPFYCSYPDGKVGYHVRKFNETVQRFIELCESDDRLKNDFGKQLIESAKGITHLITDYRDRPNVTMRPVKKDDGTKYVYNEKTVLCPRFDGLDSVGQRSLYSGQKELWWYGCNTPNAPYPSYHIDDAGYAARMVGWFMGIYGIEGNLYWCANFFKECNTTGTMRFFDDPYSLAHMGTGANGDGALLYPGKPYGIFGPVCSIRLKAIRSGYEEYEIIKFLKKEYGRKGLDFSKLFALLVSEFTDGIKIDPFYGKFRRIRDTLIRLYELYVNYTTTVSYEKLGLRKVFVIRSESGSDAYYSDGRFTGENGEPQLIYPEKNASYAEFFIGKDKKNLFFPLKNKVKIIPHEKLYEKGVFSVNKGSITINRDDIRREINVVLPGNKPELRLELSKVAKRYVSADILIRATKKAGYKVLSDGEELFAGEVGTGWNRIRLIDGAKNIPKLVFEFFESGEYGFGEIYLKK